MDKEREIRFLYPPLIVAAYFVWGWLGSSHGFQELGAIAAVIQNIGAVTGTVAGVLAGSTLILVAGYLLGTLTYFILRMFALLRGLQSHEIPSDESVHDEIWNASGIIGRRHRDTGEIQMATVWLDFRTYQKGIHEWIVRRWNAFNLSMNVMVGIALCWGWAWWHLGLCGMSAAWFFSGVSGMIVFGTNAYFAHTDMMGMIRYAANKAATSRMPDSRHDPGLVGEQKPPVG